jgi:hypothetical protein
MCQTSPSCEVTRTRVNSVLISANELCAAYMLNANSNPQRLRTTQQTKERLLTC